MYHLQDKTHALSFLIMSNKALTLSSLVWEMLPTASMTPTQCMTASKTMASRPSVSLPSRLQLRLTPFSVSSTFATKKLSRVHTTDLTVSALPVDFTTTDLCTNTRTTTSCNGRLPKTESVSGNSVILPRDLVECFPQVYRTSCTQWALPVTVTSEKESTETGRT